MQQSTEEYLTTAGKHMDIITVGTNMDLTTEGANMDLSTAGANMDLSTAGANMNITSVVEERTFTLRQGTLYYDRGYCEDLEGRQFAFKDPLRFFHDVTYRWDGGWTHYRGVSFIHIFRWYQKSEYYPDYYVFCSENPEGGYPIYVIMDGYLADYIVKSADDGITQYHVDQRKTDLAVFSVLLFFGISFNVIMLVTILRYKQLQTPTNYFLCSMAVGDICYMVSDAVGKMCYRYYVNYMNITDAGCKVLDHIRTMFFVLTVLHNLTIAFERYFAVCWPMKTAMRCSNKRSLKIMAGLWALSLILPAPKTQGYYTIGHRDFGAVYCSFLPFHESKEAKAMVMYMVVPLFVVPAAIMCFLYAAVTRTLFASVRQARTMKGDTEKSEQLNSRIQVVKLLWAVYLSFILSWIPNRAMEVINFWYNPHEVLGKGSVLNIDRVQKVSFANSMMNPILFFLMSRLFRNCVLHMVTCGRRQSKDTSPPSQTSQTGVTALPSTTATKT